MEIIKEIKIEEISLKDLNLKLIDLDVKNGNDDFMFLEEELNEILKDKLKQKGFKFDNLKIGYSLSYCQGDGFNFIGEITTKNAVYIIEKNTHHYEHAYTTSIEMLSFKNKDYSELDEVMQKKADLFLKTFQEEYISLCKEMEEIGYSIIKQQEEDNILKSGFNQFLEENSLNMNYELFDFDYKTQEEKGFIKVCNSGNTNIKGLWIKNQKVKITNFIKAIAEIEEYQEKVLI